MEIDIWSDVRCPFCYIGKHKFESALEKFNQKDHIEVVWHSFELDPNLKTEPKVNALDHLAQNKGMPRSQVDQMSGQIRKTAKEIGLDLQIDQSVVANSFQAHRLIQFAKSKNLGSEIEEALFRAHFSQGENIDDVKTLLKIGRDIGLDEKELEKVLSSDAFSDEVRKDEEKAAALGIRGVPFFVFNNKYAVSGAQPAEVFIQTLEKSWSEFEKEQQPLIVHQGNTCSTDGTCD